MKDFSSRWLVAALLIPVLAICGLLFFGGSNEAATSTAKGTVQVAFTTSLSLSPPSGSPIALAYQQVHLNVIAIRLNKVAGAVSDFDSHWITIPVPAGVGTASGTQTIATNFNLGGNFGSNGTAVSLGTGRSEISLDMNALQNLPVFFNAQKVAAQTYHHVELVLDPNTPGTVVPLCGTGTPRGEGCVVYPAVLQNPNTPITDDSISFDVTKNTVQPMIININLTVGPPAVESPFNAGTVTINPTINLNTGNTTTGGIVTNPAIGTVVAQVNGGKNQTLTAEISGTNHVIAVAKVPSGGQVIMNLPALTDAQGGSFYDFVAMGGGSYSVRSAVRIVAGLNDLTSTPFTINSSGIGSLTGKVSDVCNGQPIQAATLELLVPDTAVGSTCDLTGTPPAIPSNCVVVATANTDNLGNYPLPGNQASPALFLKVPGVFPAGVSSYWVNVSATGYNPMLQPVTHTSGGFRCNGSGDPNNRCRFSLEHAFLNGSIALPGGAVNNDANTLTALVMAEDSGTNNIESVALAGIQSGAASGNFSMNVPDASPSPPSYGAVASYDMFASSQDIFGGVFSGTAQGSPQQATGHTIAVSSAPVTAPAACATPDPASTPTLVGLDCAGFGSIAGTVTSGDQNTTVIASLNGVQLMQSSVAPLGPNAPFNFCLPPGSYDFQEYKAPTNTPNASPSPVGGPVAGTVIGPTTIPTPCASVCGGGGGTCLLCTGSTQLSLP